MKKLTLLFLYSSAALAQQPSNEQVIEEQRKALQRSNVCVELAGMALSNAKTIEQLLQRINELEQQLKKVGDKK